MGKSNLMVIKEFTLFFFFQFCLNKYSIPNLIMLEQLLNTQKTIKQTKLNIPQKQLRYSARKFRKRASTPLLLYN